MRKINLRPIGIVTGVTTVLIAAGNSLSPGIALRR
jgi:hypothetical protein